jgi:hypothetical protein
MNTKGKAGFIVLLSVSIVAAMVACIGLDLRFPELSLDPSWEQALVEATDQGRIFGRDLIFTYGPLHQIATQQVSFNLFPLIVGRVLIGQSDSLCHYACDTEFACYLDTRPCRRSSHLSGCYGDIPVSNMPLAK